MNEKEKRRIPSEVLEQIKNKLPEDYAKRFNVDLYIREFKYKAPEQNSECFDIIHSIITKIFKRENTLGIPEEEWHFEICSILSEKSIEELKKDFKLTPELLNYCQKTIQKNAISLLRWRPGFSEGFNTEIDNEFKPLLTFFTSSNLDKSIENFNNVLWKLMGYLERSRNEYIMPEDVGLTEQEKLERQWYGISNIILSNSQEFISTLKNKG